MTSRQIIGGCTVAFIVGGTFYFIYKYSQSQINKPRSSLYHDIYDLQREDSEVPLFRLPPNVEVHVIDDVECSELVDKLRDDINKSDLKLVGLDTEWVSRGSSRPPLALLQISSKNVCLLLRLCKTSDIPNDLKEILEDDSILKSGVGIGNDVRLIFNQYLVTTRGCVDIQPIAQRHGKIQAGSGLKALSKTVLGARISKNRAVRCGDWEAHTLAKTQIDYAALDAWIGREILAALYLSNNPKGETLNEWCKDVTDVFSIRIFSPNPHPHAKNKVRNPNAKNKEQKYLKVPKRKKVLYENCMMLGPDGTHLCSVNKKKVEWYISRNLAVLLQEEPNIIIQLKHQPKGHGHADSLYYLTPKENKCVICGNEESFVRYSIVPHCYRKYLPEEIKGHSSHDIVLLCQKCHRNACIASQAMQWTLQKESKIEKVAQWKRDTKLRTVHYAGATLRVHRYKIPQERAIELENVIKDHFGIDNLTDEHIEAAAKVEWKFKIETKTVEEELIGKLKSIEDMENFVKRWRRHFVEVMKPAHLPTGWDVNHPVVISN